MKLLRFNKIVKIRVVLQYHIAFVIEDKRKLGDYRKNAEHGNEGIKDFAEGSALFRFADAVEQQISAQKTENEHNIRRIAQVHAAVAKVEEGEEHRAKKGD